MGMRRKSALSYQTMRRQGRAKKPKVTADTLKQAGWTNSWIDGIRRWHHKNLPAHFKTIEQAKSLYLEHQMPKMSDANAAIYHGDCDGDCELA